MKIVIKVCSDCGEIYGCKLVGKYGTRDSWCISCLKRFDCELKEAQAEEDNNDKCVHCANY